MINDGALKNSKELEFVVFCIENLAVALDKQAEEVYRAISLKSDILRNYIIPEYEMLHTQSKEYIVNDLIELMKEKGVEV